MSSGPSDFFSDDESRLEREFEERPTTLIDDIVAEKRPRIHRRRTYRGSGAPWPSVTQRLVYDKYDYEDRPKPVPLRSLTLTNEDSGIKLASDSTSPNATPYPNGDLAKLRAYSGRHGTPRTRDPIDCYDARWLEQEAEAKESTVLGYRARCHSPNLSGSTDIANFVNRDAIIPLLRKAEHECPAPKNEFSAQLAEADKMEKLLVNNRMFNICAMWSDDAPSNQKTHEIRGEKRPRQISTSSNTEKFVKKKPSSIDLILF